MTSTAFLDANVLYSATWRNILMYLAAFDAFQPLWSEAVQDEWTRNLTKNRPDLSPARIARTRSLMDAHAMDAMVTGHEHLIATLNLPDPDDRHVLAAAIHGGASVIVTRNLKHFPAGPLAAHNITAQDPDTFISRLLDADPKSAIPAFAADRAARRNPAVNATEYLAALEANDLPMTVAALRAATPMI